MKKMKKMKYFGLIQIKLFCTLSVLVLFMFLITTNPAKADDDESTNCGCNSYDCFYDYDWNNCQTYFFHEICAVVCS